MTPAAIVGPSADGYRTEVVLDRALVTDLVVCFFRDGTDNLGTIGASGAAPLPPTHPRGATRLEVATALCWRLQMPPFTLPPPAFDALIEMLGEVLGELVAAGALVPRAFAHDPFLPYGSTGYVPGPGLAAMPCWVTGLLPDRSGAAQYTLLIRGKDDPERVDIRTLPPEQQDRTSIWRRKLKKASVVDWMGWLDTHLTDGLARSFNRIMVEMIDKTADVVTGLPPEDALWRLVEAGRVAFTTNTSVPLFRRVLGPPPAPETLLPETLGDLDDRIWDALADDPLPLSKLVALCADGEGFCERGVDETWDRGAVQLRILERVATGSLLRQGNEIGRVTVEGQEGRMARATGPEEPVVAAPKKPSPKAKPAPPEPTPEAVAAPQPGAKGGAWSSAKNPVRCEGCGQEWPRDPALEVACPTCHVRVGAWCKSPSGHKAMHLHRERMQAALDAGFEHPCPAAAPKVTGGKAPKPPVPVPAPAQPPVDPWLVRAARGRLPYRLPGG